MRGKVLAAALAVAVLAGPAAADGVRDRLVVSTDWLAKRLGERELVILQVGDKAGYEAGHIPGARLLTLQDIAAPMGGERLTLEMPDAETLRGKLEALGISDRSRIVVVPTREGVQSATRVVFTLDAAGLGGRTVLLDGGTMAWSAEGRPLSKDEPAPAAGKLSAFKLKPLIVDADFVRKHISAPGYAIVDARAPDFYSGARPGGPPQKPHKAGHIAGAKSVPFSAVTTADLKLASPEDIAAKFKAAGVKKGDTVIAYCHVGQQATATLFAARTLGINALLYDGSFEEWSRLDGPVEK
ncbi:sulfurtransferase [Phenylobacterium sp.]|jgi:thiosulfate/3-mercaptopyruvate sulfurtransferase|uniref:sulfurtransferase n=1 Tax=Phenylobacterium sp. TaxID=1871053 RepID=UPI002F94E3C4